MAEVKDGLPSTDFSRMNREYIKAVAENAAGGGGGGGDEGNIFYIDVANVSNENHTFTISTSEEEITAAFKDKKQCFLRWNVNQNTVRYYPVTSFEVDEGYLGFTASIVIVYDGDISYETFDYENENGVVTASFSHDTKQW